MDSGIRLVVSRMMEQLFLGRIGKNMLRNHFRNWNPVWFLLLSHVLKLKTEELPQLKRWFWLLTPALNGSLSRKRRSFLYNSCLSLHHKIFVLRKRHKLLEIILQNSQIFNILHITVHLKQLSII